MATHYDTLGVKSNASPAEIRKAYLRRARALHPDRQLDRSPSDSRKAEQAMQQVNVAWNVLSNQRKKSEYDARLKPDKPRIQPAQPVRPRPASNAPVTRPRPATAPRKASSTASAQRPHATQLGRDIDEAPGDGSVSVWASIPVLLVIGLLLGILVVTAFAGGGGPSDNRPVVPRVENTLQVGDCFLLVGSRPAERSCTSGQADGRIEAVVPNAANCPSGSQPIGDPGSDLILCWNRLIPGTANTIAE